MRLLKLIGPPWLLFVFAGGLAAASLDAGWENPPTESRLRAYWWWLNGNVTSNAITRDLEEMKAKGFGGALICDAGGAEQRGNGRVKAGPTFLTPEWRALYQHALGEAQRLGLVMSLNIQSGWNLGGPMVTAEDTVKHVASSETTVTGPAQVRLALPRPGARDNYYRDSFVVACRVKPNPGTNRPPLKDWRIKTMDEGFQFPGPHGWFLANSAPDTTALTVVEPSVPGEEDARSVDVINLSSRLSADGVLTWDVPEGTWQVLRFGYTLAEHRRVSTSSDGWQGYAIDVLDAGAFKRYWDSVVEPLIADAGPLAGKTLRYLHTDSWEIDYFNWTPQLPAEFRKRRGYDLWPWLPVLTGRILNSREESHRFLHDFRLTLGDLAIENHYLRFKAWAARGGLQIHPESGGPHYTPIDAQRALGVNDVPMSEFWADSRTHRSIDATRFFVKQPASAAHTYERKFVAAEGFTTVGPHWEERIWSNLKPSFDKALCEGLNLLVWHAFVCSPEEEGLPGIQYFAGTHFNPNTTWWSRSAPFLAYLNRCQWMLQQGLFVADACYYYGDHVPNFAQSKNSNPAKVLPGYDYDVIDTEALLTRMSVRDGLLVLPDGMSYRVLVLPARPALSLPVLRKVQDFVRAGATVVGPRPMQATGLVDREQNDAELARLAAKFWDAPADRVGRGRVISDRTARDVLHADGVQPDFDFTADHADTALDYIHRRVGDAEIYFVANRSNRTEIVRCTFRVSGKAPELWDAVTGERRFAAAYEEQNRRTTVPLEFGPCGSWFIVFREPARLHPATTQSNAPAFEPRSELAGSWQVHFDPRWGGPESVQFESLVDWTRRSEPGVRFYSGTATYRKTFDLPDASLASITNLWLDLGDLKELAEVRVNGRNLGIVWCPPFRVNLGDAVKPKGNVLEVDVVNFWPNRIIGDASLPADQRFTRTNVRQLTARTPLMESGLLGPVRLGSLRSQ